MRKCPNCGQITARTEDWACQWCAYPLLSGNYERIPKTYSQLKKEKLRKPKAPLREQPGTFPPLNDSSLPPTHAPESESEPTLNSRLATKPKRQPKSKQKSERGLVVVPIEVTVEELYSLLAMQSFRVTGVVDKVVLENRLNVYYIILAGTNETVELDVQCMFDKKHLPALNQLTKGQTVTVEGYYAGYILNMLMRDCVLVH